MNVKNTYSDWREMLRCEDVDIVSVATYTPWHAEITIASAEAGVRAVICEKPITTRLRDADRVIDACKKHGTLLAVNHPRRWHPSLRLAQYKGFDRLASIRCVTQPESLLNLWMLSSGRRSVQAIGQRMENE